jgi:RecA-family ATPase
MRSQKEAERDWFDDRNNTALDEIALRQEDRQAADGGRRPDEPHEPLELLDIAAWASRSPPEREWAVPDRFPLRDVSLMSGEGGVGKSISIMQLGAAHVLGKDWALSLPEPGPFLYVSAEEEEGELHRRLDAIAQHYGAPLSKLERDYHMISRAGKDAVLGYPNRNGLIRPTPLFEELHEIACDIHPKMIAIDTAADVFGGNEINRTQVRQFIGLARKMAIAANSAVLLGLHPSLTGIQSGTGLSGSTAWHNSVRARAYLTSEKSEDDSEGGKHTGLRQLDFMKNNYGPISASVTLQWKPIGKAGVYVTVASDSGGLDKIADNAKAEHVFIDLLRRFNEQGRDVSHKKGPSYAPAQFANEEAAKKLAATDAKRRKALQNAMNRLFEAKKIKVENYGRPSRPYNKIVEQQPDAD